MADYLLGEWTLPEQTFRITKVWTEAALGGDLGWQTCSGAFRSFLGFTGGTHRFSGFVVAPPGWVSFLPWNSIYVNLTANLSYAEVVIGAATIERFATFGMASAFTHPENQTLLDGPGRSDLSVSDRIKAGQTIPVTVRIAHGGVVDEYNWTWVATANQFLTWETSISVSVGTGTGGVGDHGDGRGGACTNEMAFDFPPWSSSGYPEVSVTSPPNHSGALATASASPYLVSAECPPRLVPDLAHPPFWWTFEQSAGSIYVWRPRRIAIVNIALRNMDDPLSHTLRLTRYFGNTLPATTTHVDVVSGSIEVSEVQEYYDARASALRWEFYSNQAFIPPAPILYLGGEATNTAQKLGYGPVGYYADRAALEALGFDGWQNRVQLRLWRWDAMTLAHAQSVVIDDGSTLSPTGAWGGAWTGATVVAGAIRAAGMTAIIRAFTEPVNLWPARTLRVRARASVASAPIRLKIGLKTWTATTDPTPNTWADIDFDLATEDSFDGETSAADSHWPISRDDELAISEGSLFGVTRCSEITLENLDAGATYDFDSIELRRLADKAKADFLPTWYRGKFSPTFGIDPEWPILESPPELPGDGGLGGGGGEGLGVGGVTIPDSGTIYRYARRFLLGRTDNQFSLEVRDSGYVRTFGTGGYSTVAPYVDTIADLAASINRTSLGGVPLWPLWSAAALSPVPDGCSGGSGSYGGAYLYPLGCLLNRGRWATELAGGGALRTPDGWEFRHGAGAYEVDGDGVTVPGQILADKLLDWPPDLGDVFSLKPTGDDSPDTGQVYLGAAMIVGGAATGLVVDDTCAPKSGVTVRVVDALDASARGDDVSGADGSYRTDAPWGRGSRAHTVTADDGASPTVTLPYGVFWSRRWHWAAFRIAPPAEGGGLLSACRDYTRQLAIAYVRPTGSLVARLYSPSESGAFQEYTVDAGPDCASPGIERVGNYLEVGYLRGTTAYLARSRNWGRGWAVQTLSGGPYVDLARCWQEQQRRLVLAACKSTGGGSPVYTWYVRVGVLQADGTYTFSAEVNMALTNPIASLALTDRGEGVVEAEYLDTSGAVRIVNCRRLASNGTGTWS